MALPNPAMSFTPFDILTAEELNNIVENVESLAAGTGFNAGSIDTPALANGAVTSDKIDFATFPQYISGTNSVTVPAGKWLIIATGSVYSATKGNYNISIAGKSVTVFVSNDQTIPVAVVTVVTPSSSTTYTESKSGGLSAGFNSVVAVPLLN